MMDEKKRMEQNEEISIDELNSVTGGRGKGHCGFTNEQGHCGFTCETDGSYDISMPTEIHCPECWSDDVIVDNMREEKEMEGINGFHYTVKTLYPGDVRPATCKSCGYKWQTTAH